MRKFKVGDKIRGKFIRTLRGEVVQLSHDPQKIYIKWDPKTNDGPAPMGADHYSIYAIELINGLERAIEKAKS